MNDTAAQLDAEELLHVAIAAITQHDHEAAMSALKRCVAIQPSYAQAHYLLGAEYAQIGLYERAIAAMRHALDLDEGMNVARFQLGLLLLTNAQPAEAEDVWRGLDPLGEEHPLFLFKAGMLHMVADRFDQARACLRDGIVRNTVNPAMSDDMRKVLRRLDELAPAEEAAGSHLLVNAYGGPDQL